MLKQLLVTKTARRRLAYFASYVFLVIVGISMVFPFIWMVLTSLKAPSADVMDITSLWPEMSYQVNASDIHDWGGWASMLLTADDREDCPVAAAINDEFRPSNLRTLERIYRAGDDAVFNDQTEMVASVNSILGRVDMWRDEELAREHLPEDVREEIKAAEDPSVADVRRWNRQIMDSAFGDLMRPAHRYHWENYLTALIDTNLLRAFMNSTLVTVATTFGQVFTSSLAAYAFARLTFPGRDKLFFSYLATMMIPPGVTLIPRFILMREMGLVDTLWAVTLPSMFTAYGTFLLRQFFMGLPTALEEAAILDGCSSFGVYRHVILPLSKPALTALSIITFMNSWRNFMWPLIVLHSPEKFTMPIALAAFEQMYGVQWTLLMAGSMIMIAPMLIAFLFGQRFFIEGIQVGGVKG